MTLGDLITRLTTGVQRDDLTAQFTNFVNEALVEIQRKRSWQAMKAISNFTIPGGASSISLATDDNANTTRFKELTIEKSPIHLLGSDNVLTPCEVWTREKILRRQARLISNSLLYSVYAHPNTARRVQVPVFLTWSTVAGVLVPTLNTLFTAETALPFSVSYYGYLPPLVGNSDQNEFTVNYPEMVVAKAKTIAFEAINDPISAQFEEVFMVRFREAAAQDAYQAVVGLEFRM